MDKIIHELSDIVFVDHSLVKKLSVEELPVFIKTLADIKKPIEYKNHVIKSSLQTLLRLVLKGDDVNYLLQIYYPTFDIKEIIELNQKQIKAKANLDEAVQKAIADSLKSINYTCVATTNTLDKSYEFTDNGVKRLIRSNYDRNSYTLKFSQLEILWYTARNYWGDVEDSPPKMPERSYAGYRYTPTITKDTIKIGCQEIERWELEALAVRQSWSFDLTDGL
jgi:hypothetical protein